MNKDELKKYLMTKKIIDSVKLFNKEYYVTHYEFLK